MSAIYKHAKCVLIITACLTVMAAHPQAKGFTGRIIDSITGEPVAGAAVLIAKIYDPPGMDGLSTDKEGRFDTNDGKFAALYNTGSIIRVSISATGYETYEEIVVLSHEQEEKEYRLQRLDKKIQRVFHIQHRDPAEIYNVIRPLCTRQVSLSPTLRTITVVENPEVIEKIESEINNHDLPYRQIWLDVLLVEASGTTGKKPRYPEQLEPIVHELGKLFKFGRYEIIGQVNAMGMEGSSLTFTSDNPNSDNSKAVFEVTVDQLGVTGGAVRLEDLTIMVYRPQTKRISTTINIPDGDMVILGASRGDAGTGSIVVLVSAATGGGI